MTEISLWLDSYDDIYSDFDSRHYLKRRISEDFLYELRTELKYKENHARDLVLLLPQQKRIDEAEKIITDSLTDFFKCQHLINQDNFHKKRNNGILLLIAGIIVMLINSLITYYSGITFPTIGLKVLLEPAGWFLMWSALDSLFYDLSAFKKERNFYKTLSEMHIHFKPS